MSKKGEKGTGLDPGTSKLIVTEFSLRYNSLNERGFFHRGSSSDDVSCWPNQHKWRKIEEEGMRRARRMRKYTFDIIKFEFFFIFFAGHRRDRASRFKEENGSWVYI